MSESQNKPLNWKPDPAIGYSVERREDGGMHYVFTDISRRTLEHWREFALDHLIDSDRLTRNLYDLRQIESVPEEAVEYAVEVGSDPSTRNIRLAVVVANQHVKDVVEEIAALTNPGGLEIGIFTDMAEAQAWLDRPLTLVV
ncbi:MAG TPA: STAS/SEC14 domain-containing protein [Anaerolineales bacterium]